MGETDTVFLDEFIIETQLLADRVIDINDPIEMLSFMNLDRVDCGQTVRVGHSPQLL
jgi:hypothetical protein